MGIFLKPKGFFDRGLVHGGLGVQGRGVDDGMIFRFESEYDIAFLGFETEFGNDTGWFELDPNRGSGTYNLTGYPELYAMKAV